MSLTSQPIDELLQLCKEGKQQAQLEVYNRYYKAMYNTALRIVKDTAAAQDVMQESFLKAFTKLDSFKGDASFGSWLKRIVINGSLNAYQKTERLAETPLENHLFHISDEPQGIAEDDYESTQVSHVKQAMSLLKDNYRTCLTLHLIEGYDYEEMSEIMQVSYANCRTMVSRAKESLRSKLNTCSV